MPKRERKQATRWTEQERGARGAQEEAFLRSREAERGASRERAYGAGGLYPELRGRFSRAFEEPTGGFESGPLATTRGRISDIYEGGGYDPEITAGLRGRYRGLQETGGVAGLPGLRGLYGEATSRGMYDPEQLAALRAGYGRFAREGMGAEEAGTFRRRATAGVPRTYDILQREAERRRSLTGGLGGGGEISQMARQMSQEQSRAATGAEADIAAETARRQLAGLGGLAGVESDVAGRRLAGLEGATGLEFGVADRIARALSGEAGLESDIAGGRRAGAQMGAGFETGVAGLRQREQLAGLQGLMDLFTSDRQEDVETGRQILQRLGLGSQEQQAFIQQMLQISQQPGVFGNIMRGLEVGSGVLGGLTGAGVFGGGGARPRPVRGPGP